MANTRVTNPVTGFNSATEEGLKLPSGTNTNQPSGVQGMIRNDTGETTGSSASAIEHHNGTNWQYFAATESPDPINGYYLVVAGGGGGNYGGGGAGGYLTNVGGSAKVFNTSAVYTVTVGTGGSLPTPNGNYPAGPGGQSIISESGTDFAITDGGGGGPSAGAGGGGGSGSGGGYSNSIGGVATGVGIGNDGGVGNSICYGGGGGGAGETGDSATNGGNGGDGLENNITGIPTYYAGGGGSIRDVSCSGTPQGGLGGGGNGGTSTTGVAGTNGLGGGGGARTTGGSGVVIIKYPTANNITIASGTSPIAADLNATVAGSTTEKFTRFTATGAVTFTIS
jgi:hypothetical protein